MITETHDTYISTADVNKRMDEFTNSLKELRKESREDNEKLESKMDSGFKDVNNRVDTGFTNVNNRVDTGFTNVNNRIDGQYKWVIGGLFAIIVAVGLIEKFL